MLAVQPLELLGIEYRRVRADALEGETALDLLEREQLLPAVVGPAEQRQEVDQRRRQEAEVPIGCDRGGAVALRKTRAVRAQDHRHVREPWRRPAGSLVEEELPR